MQPEDTVLVVILNNERDFALAREASWYRIPSERAPDGIHAQYLAFYQTKAFGDDAFAIHYYARILGVELATRRDLFPDEPDHPRARNAYYKILLGPLVRLPHPIISRKWRRVTFLVTTGERFQNAWELNDLVLDAPEDAVVWRAIRDLHSEQGEVREPSQPYQTSLPLWYAFSDESGNTKLFSPMEPFLVTAAILTCTPRPIELHVKRTLKKWGTPVALGELKAAHTQPAIITRLLAALAQEDIAIVGVVLDKRSVVRPPADREELYRMLIARLGQLCVIQHPRLEWYLDRKYTQPYLAQALERSIRRQLTPITQESVLIFPTESHTRKELQAADFVAWALAQKYLGREEFWKLVEKKAVVEEMLKRENW
jgi:hypothetical protein